MKTDIGPHMRRSVEELVVEIEERIDVKCKKWMDAEIERRVFEIIEKRGFMLEKQIYLNILRQNNKIKNA